MTSSVYTIPSGVPFLRSLAVGLMQRHARPGQPDALADIIVLLPTRRAVAALTDTFLELIAERGGGALILPRLFPLGDPQEDAIDVAAGASGLESLSTDELPPAMPPLRRTLHLARLTHAFLRTNDPHASFGLAYAWAESLGDLFDEAAIAGADLTLLDGAVPEDLAGHWDISRRFLGIVAEGWPSILAEEGAMDAIMRRNRLIERQAEVWSARPPGSVYLAGSTGSQPATAHLMRAVAALPEGAVVLPGLDRDADDAAWAAIDLGHPQWGLKAWLDTLSFARSDVDVWPAASTTTVDRLRLISEALRPAPTTDSWAKGLSGVDLNAAAEGLFVCDADDQAEEARIIGVLMRETIETPDRTAALVTPDRDLARRVSAEMARWGIRVDDSAGTPLDQSPPFVFLRLVAAAFTQRFAPVALLALLKHGFAVCRADVERHAEAVGWLERLCLRGPRPRPGLDGIAGRLVGVARRATPDVGVPERGLALAQSLIERLSICFSPLSELADAGPADVGDWARAHVQAAVSLCGQAGDDDMCPLWQGPDGQASADQVTALADARGTGPVSFADYRDVFERCAVGKAIRPRSVGHPRLAIWGPLEARLQSADLIILGGLTEETWPQRPDGGPWVNLAMRRAAGLPDPERFVGLAAHDFQELASAPRVVLTVPAKVGGQPALPSRWVQRLRTYMAGQGLDERIALPPRYRAWARGLDRPARPIDTKPPRPCPPVSIRPRTIRVTEIEKLLRDPYAIYARRILGLVKLDPIDQARGPRELGTLLHSVLEAFIGAVADPAAAGAREKLLEIGGALIAAESDDPFERTVWLSRLSRAADKLIAWECAHRARFEPLALEASGALDIPAPMGPVKIIGKADRIDRALDGASLAILDYKTGSVPSIKQVESGLAPQLPVEGLMAERGAFEGVGELPASALIYLQLGGGGGFSVRTFEAKAAELVAQAQAGLSSLLARFDDPHTPYLSWPMPERMSHAGDYDLLARVRARGPAGEAGE